MPPKKSPKHAKYFEGILQLRDPNEEVLDFVAKEMEKNKITLAKTKEYKNGIDLYLSSQRFIRAVGKKLQDKFGGVLKMSKKLHTVSKVTSKSLYRVTVFFKMLPFRAGDVIKYQGEEWKILSIDTQVRLKNIKSGKKKQVKTEELA